MSSSVFQVFNFNSIICQIFLVLRKCTTVSGKLISSFPIFLKFSTPLMKKYQHYQNNNTAGLSTTAMQRAQNLPNSTRNEKTTIKIFLFITRSWNLRSLISVFVFKLFAYYGQFSAIPGFSRQFFNKTKCKYGFWANLNNKLVQSIFTLLDRRAH